MWIYLLKINFVITIIIFINFIYLALQALISFAIKYTDNAMIAPGIATKITKIKGPKGSKSQ